MTSGRILPAAVAATLSPAAAGVLVLCAVAAVTPANGQTVPLRVEQIGAIGVLEGDPNFMFGDVAGIAVDPKDGTIFVFDALNLRLSAFTASGEFIDAVGRSGSGPAEFLAGTPHLIGSTVYVSDYRNNRISKWSLIDGKLRNEGQISKAFGGSRCSNDTHILYEHYTNNRLVQRVDPANETINSFGGSFYTAPGLNPVFLPVWLACADDALFAASSFSLIRSYDPSTGRLQWESSIPGVIPPNIRVDARTGIPQYLRRPDGQKSMRIVSMVVAPGHRLLVQVTSQPASMSPGASESHVTKVQTVVYDTRTGKILDTRNDLPRLDYAKGERVYSWASDPFPQIRIYRWR